MPASLDDILTAVKNAVVGINNIQQTLEERNAQYTSQVVTSSTLITAGAGKLINFCVLVAGAAGTVNDSATTGGVAASNALVATPATVGVTQCDVMFTDGLVVVPGAGQSVNVTYRLL